MNMLSQKTKIADFENKKTNIVNEVSLNYSLILFIYYNTVDY